MEKERYILVENFGRYIVYDRVSDKYYSTLCYSTLGKKNAKNLANFLNQQDARIKELEEEN